MCIRRLISCAIHEILNPRDSQSNTTKRNATHPRQSFQRKISCHSQHSTHVIHMHINKGRFKYTSKGTAVLCVHDVLILCGEDIVSLTFLRSSNSLVFVSSSERNPLMSVLGASWRGRVHICGAVPLSSMHMYTENISHQYYASPVIFV